MWAAPRANDENIPHWAQLQHFEPGKEPGWVYFECTAVLVRGKCAKCGLDRHGQPITGHWPIVNAHGANLAE